MQDEPKQTTLQRNIARLSRERGMSMRELSLRASLNETAVKAIMAGKSGSPREQTVRAIATALGVGIGELIGEAGAPATVQPMRGYGPRIAAARADRQVNDSDFARELGVPVELLRLWEAEVVAPDMAGLGRLRRAGISADWVLFGAQDTPIPQTEGRGRSGGASAEAARRGGHSGGRRSTGK